MEHRRGRVERLWRELACGLVLLLTPHGMTAADDAFAACEVRFAQAPDRWESARCFYETAASGRRWNEAARRLDALTRLHPDRPWPRLARAYVERERNPASAATAFRAAIAAFVIAGHREGEVRARGAFADWLTAHGEKAAAGEQLALAVQSAEAAGASGPLAEALIFQARRLRNLGASLQEAYRLARRAESLLFPRGDAVRQMLCLELLARLERNLGRPGRAENSFRRLELLARANGRRSLEAKAELGLGGLLVDELDRAPRNQGREKSLAQLQRALATSREVGDPQLEAGIRANLAHLLAPPENLENLDRCLSLVRGRDDVLAASCLLSLARLQAGLQAGLQADAGRTAAEHTLAEARAVAERSGDPATLARFWYGRMNIRWRFGPRPQAIADSMEALRAVEALRDGQLEQMGRAGLFSRWLAPYYAVSGHLLEAFHSSGDPADLERAFTVTESMRARVLRDLLAARSAPDPPVSMAAIVRGLAPAEALLSFQIAPRGDLFGFAGGSWLLVLTRGRTRVYRLPETAERASLETAVSAFLGLIARRDDGEAELAAVLGSQLLGPALAELPPAVNRLVVVPDGALHLLPFAGLRLDRRGPPLADRYRISTAPSAALWARWRGQARRPARAALVLADPILPAVLVEAASRQEGGGRLPGARREGRRVLRRLGRGSVLRAGSAAGEAFLKRQDLSRFGVLHFAAHAVADEADPEASAVLLAADAPGEDGRLGVDEISGLDLRGSLVALSSCRSASGALVGGEGVMSLSRAFFAAGAAAVVGSLWPVRDDDAEAFFAVFYDRLAQGATASAAFTAAQRERLHDGAPAEAWAGFVLAGDGGWRLAPPPRGSPVPQHLSQSAGVMLLLLAAGLLAVWAARRRRSRI